ncbi:hypothetical protein E6C27_scaffold230G00400 [Cucumis melo var. makuwa]|uniref:Uncharacterized protein n=1 Tax=Cucumis melo var. makuwa TaxID=1194695 RepID=A0A5A7TTJ7_CUCMM|nr:hypothetical protein E6C27_scaffold230G00400 [Cucumis melo var. makuwa]
MVSGDSFEGLCVREIEKLGGGKLSLAKSLPLIYAADGNCMDISHIDTINTPGSRSADSTNDWDELLSVKIV